MPSSGLRGAIYKRILVKISGEAMVGEGGVGIDLNKAKGVALEISGVRGLGVEVGVVTGGGNLIRGAAAPAGMGERMTADLLGMLTTVINGLALQAALVDCGVLSSVYSAVVIGGAVQVFCRADVLRDLEQGKVVIFVGGTGHPYFTTDTAAALRALEIGAEVLLKATKVDGVYDADPTKEPKAVRFDTISYDEVLRRGLKVMDATAIALCREHQLPIVVFRGDKKGVMERIVLGEKIGSLIG